MSLLSRLMARLYKLPTAQTYDIVVDKGLQAPMPDGVILRADRFSPRKARGLPTVLIRTPYGRAGNGILGRLLAERGFQAVIQSCRGTDDSGGTFTPFRGEREDGLATIAWLKQQEWFNGRLAMTGPSYLGFTQWAVARDAGPMVQALCIQVSSSEFRSVIYPGESLQLEIFVQWMQTTFSFRGSLLHLVWSLLTAPRRLKTALWQLPLEEADHRAIGKTMPFWQDWLTHTEPGDPWWAREDFSSGVAEVTAPTHLTSGWYDFMLPQLLRDYAALQQAGRQPYLTIGPWSHSSNGMFEVSLSESIHWLRAHLLGERRTLRTSPVRIYVMGASVWRDLEAWPPGGTHLQRWYLRPKAALSTALPAASSPSTFLYDPADPTPSVGGATNAILGRGTGARDNRKLEARPDVLVFTSAPLVRDTEVIGPIAVDLFVHSTLEHTDFFVRLTDVEPSGTSLNVCDGIQRLAPGRPAPTEDGSRRVCIELWPTAYRFKRGHRLRVQVSSGAFPRFARNLGTGEPLSTATTLRKAEQQVYHDPNRPSAIILPVIR